jgi:hypothetical protein
MWRNTRPKAITSMCQPVTNRHEPHSYCTADYEKSPHLEDMLQTRNSCQDVPRLDTLTSEAWTAMRSRGRGPEYPSLSALAALRCAPEACQPR